MHRITKPEGIGITGPFNGKIGLLSYEPSQAKQLKELADEAVRVGCEKDEDGLHLNLPPTSEFLDICEDIKGIIGFPTESVFDSIGLKVIYKEPCDFYPNKIRISEGVYEIKISGEPLYFYIWKKGEPRLTKGERILRTDNDALEDLISVLHKIEA
jgi:hypothetical protein